MKSAERIDRALEHALSACRGPSCPPGLDAAVRYAVFPGGARIRPQICFAVAEACGEDQPAVTDAAAAAIELLHCASLVHDDLPCFDDSPLRRGRPSVHQAFGERLAVLTGDALIVLAFQVLARGAAHAPGRLPALIEIVAGSCGMPDGICAGQAWECEPEVKLAEYQQAKTGALFAAATMAGAAATGADAEPWHALGVRIGNAYQVVDDILDVVGDAKKLGKPLGQDEARERPSYARELGLGGARRHFEQLMERIADEIPSCPGARRLQARIAAEARKFLPGRLAEDAA
ncbi:MAG: polyprenyl synthetase family protein [Wenzhouxiangellaceae bacterium]